MDEIYLHFIIYASILFGIYIGNFVVRLYFYFKEERKHNRRISIFTKLYYNIMYKKLIKTNWLGNGKAFWHTYYTLALCYGIKWLFIPKRKRFQLVIDMYERRIY